MIFVRHMFRRLFVPIISRLESTTIVSGTLLSLKKAQKKTIPMTETWCTDLQTFFYLTTNNNERQSFLEIVKVLF